ASVREVLLAFCDDANAQKMVAELLGAPASSAERRLFLLDTIDGCRMKEFPAAWVQAIGKQLDAPDARLQMRAVGLIRSRGITGLDEALGRLAAAAATPDDLRTSALAALISRRPQLDAAAFDFLLARLDPHSDAALRLAASEVLGRAELSHEQLLTLAQRYLPQADPLAVPNLLEAFRNASRDPNGEQVGMALVGALEKSTASIGNMGGKRLDQLLKSFPPQVQAAAKPLFARFEKEQQARIERLRQLAPLLTAGGDVGRGRRVFYGKKVGCYKCHTIGAEGGHVGPDLTGVGAIRSGHDLLEAIVFPGASFVPGYEVYRVETAGEALTGLIVRRTPEAVVLLTGPNGEERIPRNKIVSIQRSDVSLMPDGLDESLTREELTDLLAFLQSQKSRGDVLAMSGHGNGAEVRP
ncbi:MAG TPA: hypothetical protein VEU62_13065, partial [Bryobacterales bacterium]|nr:hypothetical protein [Bryobacterales bacterium]